MLRRATTCIRQIRVVKSGRPQRQQRPFGDAAALGFECSSSSWNMSAQGDQIERALQARCSFVVGQSGPYSLTVYERFMEMMSSDQCDASVVLGHRLRSTTRDEPSLDAWQQELQDIKKCLADHTNLNFVTIPLTALCKFNALQSDGQEELEARIVNAYLDVKQQIFPCDKTKIGIDISTDFLYSIDICDGVQKAAMIARLVSLVRRLHAQAGLRVLVLPVNCYSSSMSKQISTACIDLKFEFTGKREDRLCMIGVDLYRAHPRRPGLFCCEDIAMLSSIPKAVAELTRALDTCMSLERKYMEQMHDPSAVDAIQLQTLCIGHVLAAQFLNSRVSSSMRLLEEWEYIKETQISDSLAKAFDILRARNKKAREWVFVYQPLNRFMITKFEDVLRAQQLEMQSTVFDSIKMQMDQSTSSTCSDVQDFLLHQIRQDFSHFDVICTSGTRRIECMEWSSQLGIKDDVVTQRSQISQHSHLKNINNAIRSVLRQYYSDV